jgi:hypothetical protein
MNFGTGAFISVPLVLLASDLRVGLQRSAQAAVRIVIYDGAQARHGG